MEMPQGYAENKEWAWYDQARRFVSHHSNSNEAAAAPQTSEQGTKGKTVSRSGQFTLSFYEKVQINIHLSIHISIHVHAYVYYTRKRIGDSQVQADLSGH